MELLDFHLQLLPRQPSSGSHGNKSVMTSYIHYSVHEASQCMQQFIHDFYGFLTDLSGDDFEDHVS